MKNLITLCLAMGLTLIAQGQDFRNSSFFHQWPSFSDSVLQWTIETDLRQLMRHRIKEEYQPAQLRYIDQDGSPIAWNIQLKSRGNTRREVCIYPPLKLKFDKDDLKAEGFHPIHKIKIVNQCSATDQGLDYLFREYLIYWMYSQISPYHFEAQLAKITYKDSQGDKKDWTLYAIVLEPVKDVEYRLFATEIEREESAIKHMANEPYKRLTIFQYMIGNTDWAVHNLHNLKIFKVPEERKVVPIPYDFDYAGLIDTHYAVPHESLPISKVTDRLYRGPYCAGGEALAYAQFFLEKETLIKNYVRDFHLLNEYERSQMIDYLDGFFREMQRKLTAKSPKF